MSISPSSTSQLTAVWFDIDGTLLDTHQAGRLAFREAIHSFFGWKDGIEYIDFAGATDLQVLRDIAHHNRGEDSTSAMEQAEDFFAELGRALERCMAETRPAILPGVSELVQHLAADKRVLLGLVTGNAEDCAYIKLKQAELDAHFDHGGFGNQHPERAVLAGHARQAAHTLLREGQRIGACFVIGDTPRDIEAALAIDACAIGVATGTYSAAALEAAGADYILDDLSDLDSICRILGLL